MKRYRLKRDHPPLKAGTIFQEVSNQDGHYYEIVTNPKRLPIGVAALALVDSNPEYFELLTSQTNAKKAE